MSCARWNSCGAEPAEPLLDARQLRHRHGARQLQRQQRACGAAAEPRDVGLDGLQRGFVVDLQLAAQPGEVRRRHALDLGRGARRRPARPAHCRDRCRESRRAPACRSTRRDRRCASCRASRPAPGSRARPTSRARDRSATLASPALPKPCTEPCASPMRSVPAGVATRVHPRRRIAARAFRRQRRRQQHDAGRHAPPARASRCTRTLAGSLPARVAPYAAGARRVVIAGQQMPGERRIWLETRHQIARTRPPERSPHRRRRRPPERPSSSAAKAASASRSTACRRWSRSTAGLSPGNDPKRLPSCQSAVCRNENRHRAHYVLYLFTKQPRNDHGDLSYPQAARAVELAGGGWAAASSSSERCPPRSKLSRRRRLPRPRRR